MTNTAIRPTRAEFEAMDDASIERAAQHNKFGQEHCGWKP